MEPATINIGTFILEDDTEVHDLMRQMLIDNGIPTEMLHITHDPKLFLAKLNADINICVLDHVLNGSKTGLDMIKEVKKKNKWSYVIVMSGQKQMGIAVQYLNAGANKYIDKNWEPDTMVEILKPEVPDRVNYIHVLIKYLRVGFDEAKERIKIVRFLESKIAE